MANNITLYISAFQEALQYNSNLPADKYNKFKEYCVEYSEELEDTRITIEGLSEWCAENHEDETWILSYCDELSTSAFSLLSDWIENDEFGDPRKLIFSFYSDFEDDCDEDGCLENMHSAIQGFLNMLELDYEPLITIDTENM